jgi:hypothetical protein
MAVSKYYQMVLDTLQGRTDALHAIPPERLDWAGPGAMLDLYRKTSGNNRSALIQAIGQVIQNHPVAPPVIAQLVLIAAGLDLAEVEPQVRRLQTKPFASQEPVKSAIINYLAFRELNKLPATVADARTVNGEPRPSKAIDRRSPRSEPA